MSARWYRVPIVYAQKVEVPLDGVALDITCRANDQANTCELDMGPAGAAPVIAGMKMLANIDLLTFGRSKGLDLPGVLVTTDAVQTPMTPTPDTLGDTVFLYYVTDSTE